MKDAVAYANCVGAEETKVKAVGFADRANLTQAERNDLRALVDELVTISLRKLN